MKKHGGKRKGSGRKLVSKDKKRTRMSVSVKPSTKEKAKARGKVHGSVGKYLDVIIENDKT